MKTQMMNTPKADVCEFLRKSMSGCMLMGSTMVVSMGKIPISFSSAVKGDDSEKYRYHDVMTWDTEKIFNFEGWRNEEQYMKFVTEDEKETKSGAKYVMQPSF